MSNEIKVGILAIVALGLFFWGYKFVEGKNILKNSNLLYAEYEDVGGLRPGTSVNRSGVKVGVVTNVFLNPKNLRTVIVEMDIETPIPIPKSAVAAIATIDFLGEKAVLLEFDGACKGADCAASGDTLSTDLKGVLSTMVGPKEEVAGYVEALTAELEKTIDTLTSKATGQGSELEKTFGNIGDIIQSLKSSVAGLDKLIATNSSEIRNILENIASISGAVETDALESTISAVDTFVNQLAALDLASTLDATDSTFTQLSTTLETTDAALNQLSALVTDLNAGNGTVGKLLKDEALFQTLERAAKNADLLMQDIRLHPERYRRILSKKEMEYELPTDDPAFEAEDKN